MLNLLFENKYFKGLISVVVFLFLALFLGFIVGKVKLTAISIFILTPVLLGTIVLIFRYPIYGLLIVLHYSFMVNGVERFVAFDFPYGLLIDIFLIITLCAAIVKITSEQFNNLKNPIFGLVLIWFLYSLLELLNPEMKSFTAWFYSGRGISFYQLQIVGLGLILINTKEHLQQFLKIWFVWGLIAALYGFKMQLLGVTAGEQNWLDSGGGVTHIINHRLRIFSFFSDAGQYGAAMAHLTICAALLFIGEKSAKLKLFYIVVAILCFLAFALSGSRGPLFIIAGGGLMYLFLIRNFKILIVGVFIAISAFAFLKYTSIGSGNYQIHRLRTALNPNDESLMVRIENQKKLKGYLSTRWMGGGIGSGGDWGKRFTPDDFLSKIPLDSWYVKLWVETGIIGLVLNLLMQLIILAIAITKTFKLQDDDLRQKLIVITCGYFGILIASYGNQLYGQMPTGTIMYFSLVIIAKINQWDREEVKTNNELVSKVKIHA